MRLVLADGAILTRILDASYAQWNEGLSRAAYGRWWDAQLRTSWGRDHLRRFALVDGEQVLASAKRYDFDAMLDRRPVRVMGIGAVFTQPEHRRAGHARALVEQMVEAGTRDGFDFALLFSEIDPDYYRRLGFEPIDVRDRRVAVVEKPGAPATLVRCGGDRDLQNIAEIGATATERFRFHVVRPVDLIQYSLVKRRLLAGLGPHGRRELQFFVCEEGTAAVAYVVLTVSENRWTIEECGDRDPAGARVGAILQVLLAREPGVARPRIHGWLPDGFVPPQAQVVSDNPVSEVMMMRVIGAAPLPRLSRADVMYWHADLF